MHRTVIDTTPAAWEWMKENARGFLSVLGVCSAIFAAGVWKQSIDTKFEAMAAANAQTYQTITQASADVQALTLVIRGRADTTDANIKSVADRVSILSDRISTVEGYLKPH